MNFKRILFCCFILMSFIQILKANFQTTINLISLNVPDGNTYTGDACNQQHLCSLWVAVCVTSLSTSKSVCNKPQANAYSLQNEGDLLTRYSNIIKFTYGIYGNWTNPQILDIPSTDNQGFVFYWTIWDQSRALVDDIAIYVQFSSGSSFVNFTNTRPAGDSPTNVQFYYTNPFPPPTTRISTTTAHATSTEPSEVYGVSIDLFSLNITDGLLYNGQRCSCNIYLSMCISNIESSYSPLECRRNGQCYSLGKLSQNQSFFQFSATGVYGNWTNSQTVVLSNPSGFIISVSITDNGVDLVDEFSLLILENFNGYSDYQHSRLNGVQPVELKFFWTFYNTTITLPQTTTSRCQNGGSFDEKSGECLCTSHFTGNFCQTPICLNGGTEMQDTCYCTENFTGNFCETGLYRDCYDVYQQDTSPGTKTIYLYTNGQNVPFLAYCQGGWMTVQQRVDNGIDFKKTWAEYASGFGQLPSTADNNSFNYWIGNNYLNYFSNIKAMGLQFNFKMCNDDTLLTSTYKTFQVDNEENFFTFYASGYDNVGSTGGDGVQFFNKIPFSTFDQDNTHVCSELYGSFGFWYDPSICYSYSFLVPNLNGEYFSVCTNLTSTQGILWTPLTGNNWSNHFSLSYAQMKIIPSNVIA